MFNYPRECSTTFGDLFNYPRECSTTLGDLFNYPRGFHKMRRALFLLAAVNPENWLQDKVLDNTFNIFWIFFLWTRAEIENFLHSRALRFCLEGSGIFLVLYLWRKGKFEIGFLPVGFHKIRRATGFWSRNTKSSVNNIYMDANEKVGFNEQLLKTL